MESKITLRSKDDGFLVCSFKASPIGARIVWEKDGQLIANVSECGDYKLSSCNIFIKRRQKYDLNGNLTSGVALLIKNVALADDGNYQCKVTSREGVGTSSVQAIVTGKFT